MNYTLATLAQQTRRVGPERAGRLEARSPGEGPRRMDFSVLAPGTAPQRAGVGPPRSKSNSLSREQEPSRRLITFERAH